MGAWQEVGWGEQMAEQWRHSSRSAQPTLHNQAQPHAPGATPALTCAGRPSTAKCACRSWPRVKQTVHCMRWLAPSAICACSRTSPRRTSPSPNAGQGGSVLMSPPPSAVCSCSMATAACTAR